MQVGHQNPTLGSIIDRSSLHRLNNQDLGMGIFQQCNGRPVAYCTWSSRKESWDPILVLTY